MNKLQSKLEQIRQSNNLIVVTVRNYEIGLISPCEMNVQIKDLLKLIDINKKQIIKDFKTNNRAIELLLL